MPKFNSENLSQKAADIIAERIIREELQPGERLVEVKIAGELGVSQGTIREAFRILEKKMIVTILPRRGTTVTQLNNDYAESLYDILAALYVMMIRKAMLKMARKDKKDISQAIAKVRDRAKTEDGVGYGDALFDVLSLFLRVANDPLLQHIITDLWQVTRWIQYKLLLYKKKERVDNDYELNVLELALTSDPDTTSEKVREYTQYAKEITKQAIERSLGKATMGMGKN